MTFKKLFWIILNFIISLSTNKDATLPQDEVNPEPPQDAIPKEKRESTVVEPEKPTKEPPAPENKHQRYLWVIDNGHGASTRGKRSPLLPNGKRFFEYIFNAKIVALICQMLDELGIKYVRISQDYMEYGNALQMRVKRANQLLENEYGLYPVGFSVHGNAAPADNKGWQEYAEGAETWHTHIDTPNRSSIAPKSRAMAEVFQKHIVKETGMKNRGLKARIKKKDGDSRQFYLLHKIRFPFILTENGFFNNPVEVLKMLTHSFRVKVARAHVNAILEIEEKGLENI